MANTVIGFRNGIIAGTVFWLAIYAIAFLGSL
jgi:hypothetical protein